MRSTNDMMGGFYIHITITFNQDGISGGILGPLITMARHAQQEEAQTMNYQSRLAQKMLFLALFRTSTTSAIGAE